MPAPLPFDPIAEAARQWDEHWQSDATLPMAAVTSIMRAEQILMARLNELLVPFDLTFPRYEALMLLYYSRRGSLPLGKIGDRLQVHRASVTNLIDRLEQQGLADATARTRRIAARCWRRSRPRAARSPSARPQVLNEASFGTGRLTRRSSSSWSPRSASFVWTRRLPGLSADRGLARGRCAVRVDSRVCGSPLTGRRRNVRPSNNQMSDNMTIDSRIDQCDASCAALGWREAFDGVPERVASFVTLSGVPVEALYTEADLPAVERIGVPGAFPFTRGVYPSMYRGRLWTMRQFAGFGGAAETNERFHYLLEHGQTGLSTAFDMPSLMGHDSDSPRSLGEVGREGVAVDTLDDMRTLFGGSIWVRCRCR